MNAADRAWNRRRFLQSMFSASVGVALGDDILDALDRMAPRLAMVRGADGYRLDAWYEAQAYVTPGPWMDAIPFGGLAVTPDAPILATIGPEAADALRVLREQFQPGTMRGIGSPGAWTLSNDGSESLRVEVVREYGHVRLCMDALGKHDPNSITVGSSWYANVQ